MEKISQDMKIEEGFTFLTEAGNLLFIYKKFKNGNMCAYELSSGAEEVSYEYDEEDELIGKDSNLVYAIIDNTNKIVKNQTSFYFDKGFAKSIIAQLNRFAGKNKKPYKVKKMYLLDINL